MLAPNDRVLRKPDGRKFILVSIENESAVCKPEESDETTTIAVADLIFLVRPKHDG